jgi:hypothetical protein
MPSPAAAFKPQALLASVLAPVTAYSQDNSTRVTTANVSSMLLTDESYEK